MADSPQTPAPQTPAAAPVAASPAVQQRFAADTDMLRLNIRGKEQVIPISEIRKDVQTYEAGKEALAQAKTLREETRTDQEHARRWRDLELRLKMNPQGTLQELERLAGVQTRAQETSLQDNESGRQVVPDPKTRVLEDRISQLETRQNQTVLQDRMRATLDSYPLFKQDEKARLAAEKQILASLVVSPNADMDQVAREVHSDLFELRSSAATAVRDTRAELAKTPNIPANIGSPDLSDIPRGDAKSLKDGGLLRNIQAAAARFAGQVTGNGTA